jgi:anti-anti-sigma factor
MRGWQDVHVTVVAVGDETTLSVHGQLDLATAGRLRQPLARAVRDLHAARVVVSLHGCPYLDSSGVKVLLEATAVAARHERRVVVSRATGLVREVLQVACAGSELELLDDVTAEKPAPATVRGASSVKRVELKMVRSPDSVGAMRDAMTEVLRRSNLDTHTLDRARLLAGELVTNSVEHGSGNPRMAFEYAAPRVRLEVRDDGPGFGAAEAGLGLRLVEHFSDGWGVAADVGDEDEKIVWCELVRRG